MKIFGKWVLPTRKEYKQAHGDLLIPHSYVCEDGYKLGGWIANQRNNRNSNDKYRQLNDEQIKRLDSIGMVWDMVEYSWNRAYESALAFWKENGHIHVPRGTRNGNIDLQSWVSEQRKKYKQGKLSQDRILKLAAIEIITLPDMRVSGERKIVAVRV